MAAEAAPPRGPRRRRRATAPSRRFNLLGKIRDDRGRLPIPRLALRIVAFNLLGLTILMMGSLRLNIYRDGLIEAKLQGMEVQARVVASIIATEAAIDASCNLVEEENVPDTIPCEAALDEQIVAAIFTRAWSNFTGRVRIFVTPEDYDGGPIEDARPLLLEDQVLRADTIVATELPDIEDIARETPIRDAIGAVRRGMGDVFIDQGFRRRARSATLEDELSRAFMAPAGEGRSGATTVRVNEEGQIVASVSVPIQKVSAIYGVVTAEIGGIEELVGQARSALYEFFWVALLATVVMSSLLTFTIAGPIRRLAAAADRVRDGVRGTGRIRIPEFPKRRDEIGELSESLRSMTQALYDRIEAIDHFAADVSHEIKNPLTSIRSAIETLNIAKTDAQRQKLLSVIQQDVARMDRLITDISNASRLDADLAREARQAIDIAQLLRDIVDTYNLAGDPDRPPVRLLGRAGKQPLYVFGSPSALGQVFRNLIDNAISFSPPDGTVRVYLSVLREEQEPMVRVSVADDGPGIPPDALQRIFERFYTQRPQGITFGKNSGLGLAICRQITESHLGRIWAENRMNAERTERVGAVFHVGLPLRRP